MAHFIAKKNHTFLVAQHVTHAVHFHTMPSRLVWCLEKSQSYTGQFAATVFRNKNSSGWCNMPPHTYDFVARTFNMSQMNNFQCNITNVISTCINTRLDPTFTRTSTFYIWRSKISVTLVQGTSGINKSFLPCFSNGMRFQHAQHTKIRAFLDEQHVYKQ